MKCVYCFDAIEASKALKNIIAIIGSTQMQELEQKALTLGISLSDAATLEEMMKKITTNSECKANNHRKKNKQLKNWQHNKFWQK